MKDVILDIISAANNRVSFDLLQKILEVDKDTLSDLLLELKLDGKILQTANKYSIFPDGMKIASISVTHSGNKVIFCDGQVIPLASNFFDNVILNDVVSYYINDKNEAVITSIIDRKIKDVTCKVISKGKKKKLECFYRGVDVSLPDDIMSKFRDGDIILVSIGLNNEESHHCECSFKKMVGHTDDPNIDEIVIGANYGYHNDYSPEYLEEISGMTGEITDKELAKRRDQRDIPFVTIDCVTAKDMDDGVYGYKLKDGVYRVYVTIADVSHFVKLYTEVFNRAFEFGNSCYINNTVFHMLHPVLSNDICSLNPDCDKLTKTVMMDIDENGNIINYDICKSVIRSRKRMDYTNVDKILVDKEIPSGYEEYVDMIRVLHKVSLILEKNAIERGRLEFPSSENVKEYDDLGNVVKVIDNKVTSSPSEKLIEHLMIAANVCVAKYIKSCCFPSDYRVHKSVDVRKVNDGLKYINEANKDDHSFVRFKMIDSADHPKVIQAILKKLSNLDEYPILATILLKSIERAEYSTINIGHYALSEEIYTHFTSPIRRLCDLMVHMVLDVLISDGELLDKIDFNKLEEFLEETCKQASRMERQAEAAEYDGDRLAIIKSMQDSIGCEYDAVVIDVGERIRIKVNGVDCFVKYKYLADNLIQDASTGRYYDRNNGLLLKLGAKIKVRLSDVNLNTRSIFVDILGVTDSKKLIRR